MSDDPQIRIHDESRTVAGTVQLLTDEPIELPVGGGAPGIRARAAFTLSRYPWLVPAALVGGGVAYLLLRRR